MSDKKSLEDIFGDDPFGLLNVKPSQSPINEDTRLIATFQEVNEFYEKNKREPRLGYAISEHQLYTRLKSIRENPAKAEALKEFDRFGLLPYTQRKVTSIGDILNDNEFGLLNDDDQGLFDLKHIPKQTSMPDYIAQRKPCKDFKDFEGKFIQCQLDLAHERRKLYPFKNEQQIGEGYFFVLKGVLLYVANVGNKEPDKNGKVNARLRCIFENGTESDMLLRSLAAEMYKDGRRVTEHEDKLLDGFDGITNEDEEAGYIYILKSKSDKPEIKQLNNLYKIGFSKINVEERVKYASQDPTYLMADVRIVMSYKCYNLNPRKFESLIHNFFGVACLNIDVFDKKGSRYIPREWFVVPLHVVEQAITLIINGEILKYCYDIINEEIIKK
jgi:hypothetical protein